MTLLGSVAVIVAGALVAWRWFLAAHVADKAHQRAHELEIRKEVVKADQKAIDAMLGRLSALESDVSSLRWAPPRKA